MIDRGLYSAGRFPVHIFSSCPRECGISNISIYGTNVL